MFCPLEYVEVTATTPPYIGSLPFYNTPITEIVVPSCECIDVYNEKWETAKNTYVNPVTFVSKIACNGNGIDQIGLETIDTHVRKTIRNGVIILSFPDGSQYNLLGSQMKE